MLYRSERIFSGSVQGHFNDLIDKTSGKVEFTYGDIFGENKDMAYLISVSYQERKMGSDNAEADNWEEDGAIGYYFPKEIEFRQYDVTRERFAVSGGLEYKPDDERYYYVKAIYNYFSDDENRYNWVLVPEDGTPTLTSNRAGTITGAQATTRGIKDRFEEQEIWAITIGGESTINDWDLDYSATFAHAEENEPDRLDTEFEYEAAHDFAYNYSQRGGQVPLITGGSAAIYDGANYAFKEAVVENNLAEEDEYTFQVNAKKDMEFMGLPALFKTGLKYRDKTKKLDVRNDIYEDGTFSLADVAANDTDFAFGKGPDGSYLRGDSGSARGFFNTQLGDGTLTRDDEKSDYESLANDYESEEDIFAAYLMGTVEKDAWTVTAGARIEHTEFTSKGYSITDEDPATATWVEQDKDYTDVMPAMVVRYDRSENMIFRGSWTNTLARPIFEHSANRIALNSVDSEAEVGNPDLDPYQSMNWDASVEYYAENLGIVAVSIFYKDIDDFIYQYQDPNGYTDLLGNFYNDLTTFRNGESASIHGIELTWQQQLSKFSSALDGFGIFATAIYSDSDAEIEGGRKIPLPKHSDEVYTVGFTFEKYDFFFRIAGTQRSAYLDATGGSLEEDEYIDDNFQWDITSAYDINENFQIFAQFININDEPKYAYYGQSDRVRQFEEYSWAANAGVKWKF